MAQVLVVFKALNSLLIIAIGKEFLLIPLSVFISFCDLFTGAVEIGYI